MDTQSIPTTAPTNTRELRALDLYRERGHLIRTLGDDRYEVPSCTMRGRRYIVHYGGSEERCTCKDFEFGHTCKHLLAVGALHASRRSGIKVRVVSIAGDGIAARARHDQAKPDELFAAACAAVRLLQDRQQHMPEEMLDPRERKVLRQLRAAVRGVEGL